MSSSTSVTTSTINGVTRATGLSSGIDVDSIVSELMTADRAQKLNKMEQNEQTAEWKQTDYRTMISDIQTFSSKYFDITSSSSLLSATNFLKYTATSNASAVTVTAASNASTGTHTVEVNQLATDATLSSSASVAKNVQGSTTPTYSSLSGESFILTLDGTAKTVTLDSSVTDLASLQTAVDDAVGSGKVTVGTNSSGYLTITAADSGVNAISISAPTSTSSSSALTNLGFGTDAILSNRLVTSDTLATIVDQLANSGAQSTFAAAITTATSGTTSTAKTAVTNDYSAYTTALASGSAATIASTQSTLDSDIATLSDTTLTAALTTYNTNAGTTINTDATTLSTDVTADTASGGALATLASAITTATSGSTTTETAVSTAYSAYSAALTSGVAATIVSTKTTLDSAVTALGDSTLTTAYSTYNSATDGGTAVNTAATAVTSAIAAAASELTFNTDGQVDLTINGTSLTFDKTDTLADMMSTINTSAAGVTMTYNSITGKLIMTANNTGAGNTLDVTETGSNFVSLLLSNSTAGLDCKVTLDGQSLTRSSNIITVDGVTYTANQLTTTSSDTALATTAATAKTTSDTLATAVTADGGSTTLTAAAATALAAYNTAEAAATADSSDTTLAAAATAAKTTSDTMAAAVTTYGGSTTLTAAAATALAAYNTAETNATTAATDDAATVNVTQDTDGVYDLLSSFVTDYNSLISTINTELSATSDSIDYPPLTDDQKSSMTDTEITAWNAKAQVGILENDPTLTSFVSTLRTALFDSVPGQSETLSSIGITTGTYDTKGQLSIDEDTLKAAIASNPSGVMDLFTQQATSLSSSGTSLGGTTTVRTMSSSDLTTRYDQEGLAYRFYDIIQKNISSIQDSAGNKGTLLEEAGMTDDSSDTDNTLTTLIDKYTTEISTEKSRLDTVEDNLYTKYSSLETYINTMNTQLSSLSSMNSSS